MQKRCDCEILYFSYQAGSINANFHAKIGAGEAANSQQVANSQSIILAQSQGKEADVRALSELTRALDKKVGTLNILF